jgi:hypothetical protein
MTAKSRLAANRRNSNVFLTLRLMPKVGKHAPNALNRGTTGMLPRLGARNLIVRLPEERRGGAKKVTKIILFGEATSHRRIRFVAFLVTNSEV